MDRFTQAAIDARSQIRLAYAAYRSNFDMARQQRDEAVPTRNMMTGTGPYGSIEMGGLFTVMKIRADLAHDDYRDPGWYEPPPVERGAENTP